MYVSIALGNRMEGQTLNTKACSEGFLVCKPLGESSGACLASLRAFSRALYQLEASHGPAWVASEQW